MMSYAFQSEPSSSIPVDAVVLKQQLAREITCLEGQLARIVNRDDIAGQPASVRTYQDMISSRKRVLRSL